MASAPSENEESDTARRLVIAHEAQKLELRHTEAWQQLMSLADHPEVEGIEVEPDGILLEGDTFRGAMSVYVLLRYSQENIESAEAFLGYFRGHFEDGALRFDDVKLRLEGFFA